MGHPPTRRKYDRKFQVNEKALETIEDPMTLFMLGSAHPKEAEVLPPVHLERVATDCHDAAIKRKPLVAGRNGDTIDLAQKAKTPASRKQTVAQESSLAIFAFLAVCDFVRISHRLVS